MMNQLEQLKSKEARRKLRFVLDEVSHLIKGGWIQGISAIDADGVSVDTTDPDARCFCLSGALSCALTRKAPNDVQIVIAAENLFRWVANRNGFAKSSYVHWNDYPGRTKEQVLAFVAEAKAQVQ